MALRILFWNVKGRDEKASTLALALLPAIVDNFELDVITLIEAPKDAEAQLRRLGVPMQPPSRDIDLDNPRRLLTFVLNRDLLLTEHLANRHHRAYELARAGHEPLNLVTVHLRSPNNDKGTRGRAQKRAQRCREFVEEFEGFSGHKRTAVYGDFNMDPFFESMVHIDGLNAMSTALRARGPRTTEGTTRATFYNPMWSMFGDRRRMSDQRPSPAGTYYMDDDGPAGYFWHMPDQVLVRAELSPHLCGLRVIDQVGPDSRLISDLARKPDVSDHLPVLFEFNESVWMRCDDES